MPVQLGQPARGAGSARGQGRYERLAHIGPEPAQLVLEPTGAAEGVESRRQRGVSDEVALADESSHRDAEGTGQPFEYREGRVAAACLEIRHIGHGEPGVDRHRRKRAALLGSTSA